jgi:hypothetical protein
MASSSSVIVGLGGGSANNTVDVNRIPPKKANARMPLVFCFTIFEN